MTRFPNSVDDLIRELEVQYPEVTAEPGDDPNKVFQAALQRMVVVNLKRWRSQALNPPAPEAKERGKGRRVHR